MNVADIIIRVRRIFGDEAAVQVTDDDVIRWINDGQIEIVKHNEDALQQVGFVNLVANQTQYTMPADLLLLRSLRYKYSDMASYMNLRYKSIQEFDEAIDGWDGTLFSAGHPHFFTVFDGIVQLFPTPDQSNTSGLKVLYNQKPTDVVLTSDTPSLPLVYHNTLVKYCLWQASLLDQDHDPAIMYAGDFRNDTDLLQDKETREAVATYPTITVRAEDL